MKGLACSVLVVTGFTSFAASAACDDAPMIGAVPDGATATEQQMLAARAEISAYMNAMETYLVCLDDELAAKADSATPQYKELMEKRILSGDNERLSVAESFNKALAAFRQANPRDN
jgi:hypothetical protein